MLQPIHCMEHPMFQRLLNIISHAPNRIKVPGHTMMHKLIIKKFKVNFLSLKKKLLVHMHILIHYSTNIVQ